nr:hypothetical protein [Streptomyces fulvorobeus]
MPETSSNAVIPSIASAKTATAARIGFLQPRTRVPCVVAPEYASSAPPSAGSARPSGRVRSRSGSWVRPGSVRTVRSTVVLSSAGRCRPYLAGVVSRVRTVT